MTTNCVWLLHGQQWDPNWVRQRTVPTKPLVAYGDNLALERQEIGKGGRFQKVAISISPSHQTSLPNFGKHTSSWSSKSAWWGTSQRRRLVSEESFSSADSSLTTALRPLYLSATSSAESLARLCSEETQIYGARTGTSGWSRMGTS